MSRVYDVEDVEIIPIGDVYRLRKGGGKRGSSKFPLPESGRINSRGCRRADIDCRLQDIHISKHIHQILKCILLRMRVRAEGVCGSHACISPLYHEQGCIFDFFPQHQRWKRLGRDLVQSFQFAQTVPKLEAQEPTLESSAVLRSDHLRDTKSPSLRPKSSSAEKTKCQSIPDRPPRRSDHQVLFERDQDSSVGR